MRLNPGLILLQLGGGLILLFLAAQVDTLYACDSPAVSIGQTKGEVKAICGAPSAVEKQKGKRSHGRHAGEVEEWHYNLGPQQLVRVLRFQNGKLTEIGTGGYGWTGTGAADYGCEQAVVPTGSTKAEVKARCGKPTSIQMKEGPYETWRYNLGPSRFVRIFQFQGGRLVDIKTGDYGK